MVIRNDYSDYGIPSLRQKSIFDNDYGMGQWNRPADVWGAGENRDPGMSWDSNPISSGIYPPPSVGPVQDTPFGGMFGNVMAPTMGGGAPPTEVAPPRVNTFERPSETDSLRRFTNAVNSVYSPDFTDRDRLRALMDAAPQREEPGFGRRLTAAAMGFRQKPEDTLKIQEEVMYAPHRRNMQDWTAKTEPFTKIAEIEGRQNVNERTLAGNMVNAVTQGDRIEAQRVRDENKYEIDKKKAETDRIRGEAYRFKQMNPDWEFDFRGPEIIATNPKNPNQIVRLGPTGHMTDYDKITLQNKGRVEAAQAAGAAYWGSEGQPTGAYNPRVPGGPTPPMGARPMTGSGSRAEKELSPGDAEKERENNRIQLYHSSPDTSIKKWTEFKGGKVVAKKRPEAGSMPWSWSQSDTEDYDRVMGIMWPTPGGAKTETRRPGGGTVRSEGEDYDYEDLPDGVNPPPVAERGVAAGVKPPTVAAAPPPPKESNWLPPPVPKAGETFIGPAPSAGGQRVRVFPGADKPREESKFEINPKTGQRTRKFAPPSELGPDDPSRYVNVPAGKQLGEVNIRNRAAEFLRENGQPANPADIDFVISKGWVK